MPRSQKIPVTLLAVLVACLVAGQVCGGVVRSGRAQVPLTNSAFSCDSALVAGTTSTYKVETEQVVQLTATWSKGVAKAYLYRDLDGDGTFESRVTIHDSQSNFVRSTTATVQINTSAGTMQFYMAAGELYAGEEAFADTATNITLQVGPKAAPSFPGLNKVLQAALGVGGRVHLTWPAATDNVGVTHYRVYRTNGTLPPNNIAGAPNLVTNDSATTPAFTDYATTHGQTYEYAVTAFDYSGLESSDRTSIVSITVDARPPTVASVLMNATTLETNGNARLEKGGVVAFRVNLDEELTSIELQLRSTDTGRFYPPAGGQTWTHQGSAAEGYEYLTTWDTSTDTEDIRNGVYDVRVTVTDVYGNTQELTLYDAVEIADPAPPFNWVPVILILVIVAVVVPVGIVAAKKASSKKLEQDLELVQKKGQEAQAGRKPRRRGKVYKGASAIGRKSGQEAETLVKSRKLPKAASKRKDKGKKGQASRATPSRGPGARKKPPKMIKAGTADSEKALKKAESGVDVTRRAAFVDSKVNSLETVFGMVTSLVELIPDRKHCPQCGRKLAPNWTQCPWCVIKAHESEIGMKFSMQSIDAEESLCPKCHRLILTEYVGNCPHCFLRDRS